jgi:peptide subunit release factor 1 (eRF1)
MTTFSDVTEATLRELAQVRSDGESFLSVYLDLDPAQFATPRARASEADSLLDEAHREIEGAERSHAELMALREALTHARATLSDLGELAQGARALALFVCEPLGLERPLRLAHPVRRAVIISDEPFIAPLLQEGPAGRVCAVLVDERGARVLIGPSPESLREAVSFGDDVHGRQHQGGWSQARYQRSMHEDIEAHLRHVARVLQDLLKVAPYERLLIGCTEQLWPRVLERLHPDVRLRLHEQRLAIDVSDASVADVQQAGAAALLEEERAHEDELLERLREHLGREDARAVAGLPDVLHALVERRVEALLYEDGLHAAGVRCASCGWMDLEGERCPVDGTVLGRREDIVGDALLAAISQSAEVRALRDRPELGPLGGIAAILRF